jgi:RNA polymerase sigma-70 factor (ECF subfamily)
LPASVETTTSCAPSPTSRVLTTALLALDSALDKLTAIDPRQGRVVELRFFGGLTVEEAAEVLNVAPITVKRDWALARTWLYRELQGKPA